MQRPNHVVRAQLVCAYEVNFRKNQRIRRAGNFGQMQHESEKQNSG